MPAGRPTELTPEVLAQVKALLPTVLYLETVADYLGVHRTTLRAWIKRGTLEIKRLRKDRRFKLRAAEAIFVEFHYVIKKALAEGEIYAAGTIKKAAGKQWQAAAWLLERRRPDHWAQRERKELVELVAEVKELRKQFHAGKNPPAG